VRDAVSNGTCFAQDIHDAMAMITVLPIAVFSRLPQVFLRLACSECPMSVHTRCKARADSKRGAASRDSVGIGTLPLCRAHGILHMRSRAMFGDSLDPVYLYERNEVEDFVQTLLEKVQPPLCAHKPARLPPLLRPARGSGGLVVVDARTKLFRDSVNHNLLIVELRLVPQPQSLCVVHVEDCRERGLLANHLSGGGGAAEVSGRAAGAGFTPEATSAWHAARAANRRRSVGGGG
jgi:hypothetical protein